MIRLGARDGDQVTLHDPAKDDLRRSLAVFLGQTLYYLMADDVDVTILLRQI